MDWERFSTTAMEPNMGTDSIILILQPHEKILLARYIENELKQQHFLTIPEYQQIQDEVFLFVYFTGHCCSDMQ
jgi:hypothetical protein